MLDIRNGRDVFTAIQALVLVAVAIGALVALAHFFPADGAALAPAVAMLMLFGAIAARLHFTGRNGFSHRAGE